MNQANENNRAAFSGGETWKLKSQDNDAHNIFPEFGPPHPRFRLVAAAGDDVQFIPGKRMADLGWPEFELMPADEGYLSKGKVDVVTKNDGTHSVHVGLIVSTPNPNSIRREIKLTYDDNKLNHGGVAHGEN